MENRSANNSGSERSSFRDRVGINSRVQEARTYMLLEDNINKSNSSLHSSPQKFRTWRDQISQMEGERHGAENKQIV